MKSKVAVIFGTRPEAIKLIPVYKGLLACNQLHPVLISTGQHKEMLKEIFDLFEVKPDIELDVMKKNQTLSELSSRLFTSIGEVFRNTDYVTVLVQGDTTSALVAAIVGHYHKVPVAHVEAGLRTYNKWAPFPEESNRRMISAIADFHFTPTEAAANTLTREGFTCGVIKVGNTVIDSLLYMQEKVKSRIGYYDDKYGWLDIDTRKMILVTGHRRESFGEGFKEICKAISHIAEYHSDKLIVYPVHLNPNVRNIVHEMLQHYENIKLIAPVPYDEMVYLMQMSWLILTDSGGIQEEAPSLNKPTIVMRETTERYEGIKAGCCVLGGLNTESICSEFDKIFRSTEVYQRMANTKNPYGDGKASNRIVEFLVNRFCRK